MAISATIHVRLFCCRLRLRISRVMLARGRARLRLRRGRRSANQAPATSVPAARP